MTNKNALVRYRVLDNCFRNRGKRYFLDDLINECNKALCDINPEYGGISRRQIFEDISFMESSNGWEIELEKQREGKKIFYKYSDPEFSINNMPLNDIEISQLVPKMKQGLVDKEKKDSIIEFDNNQYLKGIGNLGVLYNAVYYKKVLKINYQPFESDKVFNLIIHPYYLKQYNNRWFLFGFNPENNKYDWNLALDRILNIEEFDEKYHKNDQVDWSEYFEDIIGVTKPVASSLEMIVLRFYGKTGKYVESKPLHGSQKSKWLDENTLEVRLQLIINYELERVILSYADSVKVVKPNSLIKIIKQRSENSQYLYVK